MSKNPKPEATASLGASDAGTDTATPKSRPFWYMFSDYLPAYVNDNLSSSAEEERLKKFNSVVRSLRPQDDVSVVRRFLTRNARNSALLIAMHYSPKYSHFVTSKKVQSIESQLIAMHSLTVFVGIMCSITAATKGISWLRFLVKRDAVARKLAGSQFLNEALSFGGAIAGCWHLVYLLDGDYRSYKFFDPEYEHFYLQVSRELYTANYTKEDYLKPVDRTDESFAILKKLGIKPYRLPTTANVSQGSQLPTKPRP